MPKTHPISIHIVLVILISVMAVSLVGVAWWYEGERDVETESNTIVTNNSAGEVRLDKVVISSTIESLNGSDIIHDTWTTVHLDEESDSIPNNKNNASSETYDAIVNPFTDERFYIEREGSSTYCGPNGETSICNLVKVKGDGSTEVVADLWFPSEVTDSDGHAQTITRHGARLVKFIDAQTLELSFSWYDHGGSSREIAFLSLSDNTLDSAISYGQAEGTLYGPYVVYRYQIQKNGKQLVFQNGNTIYDDTSMQSKELPMGVYLFIDNEVKKLDFPNGPYSLVFDIFQNIQGSDVVANVNGVDIVIHLDDETFEYLSN